VNLEEGVFPRRLHRLDYLIRIVVADACLWLLLNITSPSDPTLGGLRLVAIVLGSLVVSMYSLFFVLLPRVRDSGWNSWSVILGLFPYIGPLFHLLLLFIPPKRNIMDESI
jgi:uncharacterized membrane protein YhaH (DUF805 family)